MLVRLSEDTVTAVQVDGLAHSLLRKLTGFAVLHEREGEWGQDEGCCLLMEYESDYYALPLYVFMDLSRDDLLRLGREICRELERLDDGGD